MVTLDLAANSIAFLDLLPAAEVGPGGTWPQQAAQDKDDGKIGEEDGLDGHDGHFKKIQDIDFAAFMVDQASGLVCF